MKEIKTKTHIPPQISEENSEATITAVYKKYNNRLKKYIKRRLHAKADIDADDVLQEVYLRLLKHPGLYELKFSLAFLKKIASNLLIDRFRSQRLRKREMHDSLDEAMLPSESASPEKIVQSREGMEIFNDVFENLSDNCRRAFVLSRFKGNTYDEIAEEMGISKSAVNKYMSRVLLQLGEIFDNYI